MNDVERARKQEETRNRSLKNEARALARKTLATQVRSANAQETANWLQWAAISISILALLVAIAAFVWHR